jgi:hypothetical protein
MEAFSDRCGIELPACRIEFYCLQGLRLRVTPLDTESRIKIIPTLPRAGLQTTHDEDSMPIQDRSGHRLGQHVGELVVG